MGGWVSGFIFLINYYIFVGGGGRGMGMGMGMGREFASACPIVSRVFIFG